MKPNVKVLASLFALLVAAQAHAMRWYSPSTGRWFSRDPIGERGGNHLYGFCRNYPIGLVDILGLDALGDSLIDGPKKIVALDKTYPVRQTTTSSYKGAGTVCGWASGGKLSIPPGKYTISVGVYPTGESADKDDSSVSVQVGTAKFTKTVTVVRPVLLTRTFLKKVYASAGPIASLRLDFDLTVTDQFDDPLPEGITVGETINIVKSKYAKTTGLITGSSATDSSGTVGDHHIESWKWWGGFADIVQTVVVGNWQAVINESMYSNGNWTGDMESNFH